MSLCNSRLNSADGVRRVRVVPLRCRMARDEMRASLRKIVYCVTRHRSGVVAIIHCKSVKVAITELMFIYSGKKTIAVRGTLHNPLKDPGQRVEVIGDRSGATKDIATISTIIIRVSAVVTSSSDTPHRLTDYNSALHISDCSARAALAETRLRLQKKYS
ncbi:hypothetical protein EVAR_54107_1 [Eumeta japonica]|uniref:Uncharacterized protein n=1 Tax=Eumeta variegata TaxID=151549 RepID=A0A4C1Z1C9_EUMVA|nr:hypothetical protein EVAR_54107_1 [Eumeta japonica]